jgi:hypothetical protein
LVLSTIVEQVEEIHRASPARQSRHKKWFCMNYSDVSEYKPLGSNPYEPYFEKIARVQVRGDKKSITGKVVAISERFLTLEHLDGRKTLIRTDDISVISAIPKKAVV